MTAGQTIDYAALTRDAMRGVVRTVLLRVAKSGLPGDHHFFICFDTRASGVVLSKRLREKYPREMTIVLQYRFWDLAVSDDRFEVKLTFDGIFERLAVPFAAIKGFFDPSVSYGLRFDEPEEGAEAGGETALSELGGETAASEAGGGQTTEPSGSGEPLPASRRERTFPAQSGEAVPAPAPAVAPPQVVPVRAPAGAGEEGQGARRPAAVSERERPAEGGGGKIVSLDAFRNKK